MLTLEELLMLVRFGPGILVVAVNELDKSCKVLHGLYKSLKDKLIIEVSA